MSANENVLHYDNKIKLKFNYFNGVFRRPQDLSLRKFVSMTVSIESYSLTDGGLINAGSYLIAPQRIPI